MTAVLVAGPPEVAAAITAAVAAVLAEEAAAAAASAAAPAPMPAWRRAGIRDAVTALPPPR